MNLYEISFTHYGPKDSKMGVETYLLAENEEEVYDYIDKNFVDGYWSNKDGGEPLEIYDNKYEVIDTESFKEKMIRLKGDVNDEDHDFGDAYYGITLYGWDLIKKDVSDYPELIELGIFKKVLQTKYKDKYDVGVKDGDIIDLHQTVNGCQKFVIVDVGTLDVRYGFDHSYKYEYDVHDLLSNGMNGETEYEIIGNILVNNDMVCPVSKNICDDECCTVGSICNLICSSNITNVQ